MAETSSTSRAGGIGFLGLLTIVFVILKLNPGGYLHSGVEGWTWLAVFSPILIPWAIALVFGLFFGIVFGVFAIAEHFENKHNRKKHREIQAKQMAERRARMRNLQKRTPTRIIK